MAFLKKHPLPLLLLFFCVGASKLNAQIAKDTGEVFIEISSIISDMPGSPGNDYSHPSDSELNTWGNVLKYLLDNNYTMADETAAMLDYDLIQFLDTSYVADHRIYYILKSNGSNYWGTYIYNPNFYRNLVIQSPHPKKDYNTGKEGVYVFHETNSLFFMLSGTHRCNHSSFSPCAGETKVCSDSDSDEKFRISDMAHVLSTIYQSTTDTLLNRNSDTYFIQLHGFTKGNSDPYVILSNGTRVTPSPDYIASLETNLEAEDPLFVNSIKVAHQDLTWEKLIGFTNVQGRLINSSADVCSLSATTTEGRFIHMEQEKTKLREDETGWSKVANAIKNTFENSPLPIKLIHFEVNAMPDKTVLVKWSTASEVNNDFFTVERSLDGVNWENLKSISGAGNSSSILHYQVVDYLPLHGVSYYRLKQTDYDGRSEYSKIRAVNIGPENSQITIYPNPTTSFAIVKGSRSELKTLTVYNALGLKVAEGNDLIEDFDKSVVKLDLSDLATGMYIIITATTTNKIYKQ